MKTFLLSKVKRLKKYSQELDAKAVLYDKSWEVFNETGDKELMIFRPNQELLISRNGIIQKGKWELLDIANIIIEVGEVSYLLNASYIEDEFLALKLDGTERYMVMIEADMKNRFSLNSIQSIEGYLDNRYKRIEAEKEAKNQEKKRIEKRREEEKERKKELKRKSLILEQKERERQERQKREQEERKEKERIAQEKKEKRIAEAKVLEDKRKEKFIDNFKSDNPKKYQEILDYEKREIAKTKLKSDILSDRSWVRNRLLIANFLTISILVMAIGIVIESPDNITNRINIIGIPAVIIALIYHLWSADMYLMAHDIRPKRNIFAIIKHSIVLFLAYLAYIECSKGGDYSFYSERGFIIFMLASIAIKTIISVVFHIVTIHDYYSLFSLNNNEWLDNNDGLDNNDFWLDCLTDNIYDAITNYKKQ